MATTYYLRSVGGNFSANNSTWSLTTNGAATNAHPVAGDTATCDVNSSTATLTVDAASACAAIVCTGFTGTLTFTTFNLTTTSTVTLVSGMTINVGTTATWNMGCSAVAFTPGGKTLGNVNFNVTGTLTITGGVMACSGVLSVATGVTVTLASQDINVSGGLTVTGTGIIQGVGRTINLSGGTWSGTSTGAIQTNLTITGSVIISGNVYYGGQTITTSGATITSSSGVVNFNNSSTITDSNANTPNWAILSINASANVSPLTLSQATTVLNISVANTFTLVFGTNNITVKSSIDTKASGAIGVGTNVIMDGSGASPTWQSTGWTSGKIATTLAITGAITISGNVGFGSATITTSSATITWSSGTVNILASCTITDSNSGTPNWAGGSVSCAFGSTLTLSQDTTVLNIGTTGAFALTLASHNLIVKGNISCITTGSIAGQTITMTGASGTAVWSHTGAGFISSNLTITGAVTISGNVYYKIGTITTSAATITWSSGVFNVTGSCTLTDSTTNTPNWAAGTITCTTSSVTLTLSQNTVILNLNSLATAQLTFATSNITVKGNIDTKSTGIISGQTITMDGSSGTSTWLATGWTNGRVQSNLTITGAVTISGNVGFGTSIITTSSGTITWSSATFNIVASCTITDSNSGTPNWAGGTINASASATLTLSQITTCLNLSNLSANTMTLASNDFIVNGNLSLISGIIGTRSITLKGISGTATVTGTNTQNMNASLIFLAGANTVTFSGIFRFSIGTITYTSGNIVTTGSSLFLNGAVTLNTNGISWNNITTDTGTVTITLSSPLTCTGIFTVTFGTVFSGSYLVTVGSISQGAFTLTLSANMTCTGIYTNTGASIINGAFTLSIGGNLTLAYAVSGTASITMNGTGAWTASNATCTLSNALTFAGTITVTGSVYYNNATMTYSSGTVNASGDTIYFNVNCSIIGASGITFGTIDILYNIAVTADSSVTCTDLNMYYLSQLTLTAASTLTVSHSMQLDSCTILSATPSSPCYLTYNGTAVNNKSAYLNATDLQVINAINVWNAGTLLRTLNINSKNNPVNLFVIV